MTEYKTSQLGKKQKKKCGRKDRHQMPAKGE